MSAPKLSFHVETVRLDAHGSRERCKETEIMLDTDLQCRTDIMGMYFWA